MKGPWWLRLILILLVACSHNTQKDSHKRSEPLSEGSVSLDHEFIMSETRPSLEGSAEGVYGPTPFEQVDDFDYATQQAKLIPVTGLYLGAGLMRASLHVNLLKALEYHGLQVHMMSGSGLGAVLATMYAFGLTPDLIEWRVFKFMNAVEGEKPLTQNWMRFVYEILLEDLAEKRVEQAGLTLALPLYDRKQGKVVLLSRGRVKALIDLQFKFSSSSTADRFLSPILQKVSMADLMREQGSDLSFAALAVGEKLKFKKVDNFLAGIYGRLIGFQRGKESGFDYVYMMPTSHISLDSSENVDEEIEKTTTEITEQVSLFKDYIKKWKYNKSDSQQRDDPRVFDQDFLIRENN